MRPLTPETGWGVLHLFCRVDRDLAVTEPGAAKRFVDAVRALERDGHQAMCFTVVGHKADLGIMALGPDVARLHAFEQELLDVPVDPVWSYISLTELSEYTSTEEDERERLASEEGLEGGELETRLAEWRQRMDEYREHRLHPRLPERRLLCFYPMSKRRDPDANWYDLSFAARKELMQGHARVGRRYAGRVLQLITGSTGLDDWEWGVTLLADEPTVLKEIVSEMRFDPVSARYAEFGPFVLGLCAAVEEVAEAVGLQRRSPEAHETEESTS